VGLDRTKLATFTITRSGLTTGTSSVKWSTANGTASAGSDYTAVSNGTVSFAAGQTSKTVSVTVAGDTLNLAKGTVSFAVGEASKTVSVAVKGDTAVEPNETFSVVLSSPVQATIIDGTGVATIVNDD